MINFVLNYLIENCSLIDMYKFLVFPLFLFIAVMASAQAPQAAICSTSVKMISAEEGEITVVVKPNAGWHIYSFDVPKGGPRPMKFVVETSEGIKLIGKPKVSVSPEIHHDAAFDMEVSFWSKPVTVTQRFKILSDECQLSGYLEYQGCNGDTCAPPKKIKFSHKLTR